MGTVEWNQVEQDVMVTGFARRILHIERIQNRWLWSAHEQLRQRLLKKNEGVLNEKTLFHGTSNTPPNKTCDSEQGFDSRLSRPGFLGVGSYFATKARYSDHFAFKHPRDTSRRSW